MTKVVDSYFFMPAYKNITSTLRKQDIGKTSVSIKSSKILFKQEDKSHPWPGRTVFPVLILWETQI